MNKIVVSIIGLDAPGVVCVVSSTLAEMQCNIEEVSQTILQNQFAAIFVTTCPPTLSLDVLKATLEERITAKKMLLSVTIRAISKPPTPPIPTEPFVITVDGPDTPGLISGISKVFAEQYVNIENMKAIMPEDDDTHALIVFEVALPLSLDFNSFRRTLGAKATHLGLKWSMQHRDIFEAIHRVATV